MSFDKTSLAGKSARDLYKLRAEKAGELAAIFDAHRTEDGQTYKGTLPLEEVRNRNEELNAIGEVYDEKAAVEMIAANASNFKGHKPYGDAPTPTTSPKNADVRRMVKTIGECFAESKAGREFKGSEREVADFDVKTLFETGAGWAPEVTRSGQVIMSAQRIPNLIDIIPSQQTTQSGYKFMKETTFTNNAAPTAEGGTYPEAALELQEVSVPIEKIPTWLPVTDEQLDDENGSQSYIQDRLTLMLRQSLETQIVSGDGTSPNLQGFANISGIQTQPKGSDPVPDAVYRAMTKIRVTGRAMPNAVLMHPNDWQDVRLLRTTDGIYIWGSPSEAGPARIWGLPVYESTALTENTGMVLDTSYFLLVYRAGISFKVSDSHSDYFVKGKQAIRAQMRAGLVPFRPAALCTVTSI
ncbi:major capsid protein [Bacteriophage sp.]|nr:major capsid protein [Bacteriophage sp.]